MKILVDKVPDNVLDCPFAEYSGSGFYECKLGVGNCPLCYNHECDRLVGINMIYAVEEHITGHPNFHYREHYPLTIFKED